MTWEALRGFIDGNGKIIACSPRTEPFVRHHGVMDGRRLTKKRIRFARVVAFDRRSCFLTVRPPLSLSASATLCRAIPYAAVRNVTFFSFAKSRTDTYAFVIVAFSSRFTCSCVQRYCWRFWAHS